MTDKKIDEMSDAERMNGFLAAWKEYKTSGFEVTQEAANKIAAAWKVEPPKLQELGPRRHVAAAPRPVRRW